MCTAIEVVGHVAGREQAAVGAVDPAVVGAHELACIAAGFEADQRAAVAADQARQQPRLVERGGGARDIEVRTLELDDDRSVIAVHVLVDTRDAMGANLVNSMCEAAAPRIAELCGGEVALRILSNLADRAVVRCRVSYRLAEEVRDGIVLASDIARADPYRATTHNKGIMNGVDALAIATGNDWRAIEAGAHAFVAASGRYRSLTRWHRAADGALAGEITLPLKVGTVGGTLAGNPAAALGLALTGAKSAKQLAELMAAVGLAQNFAALRALATDGIQAGHMKLHSRHVAAAVGAAGTQFDEVVERLVADQDKTEGCLRLLMLVEA